MPAAMDRQRHRELRERTSMAKKLKSAFVDNLYECYECGSYDWIELHHIFGGSNRKHSEECGYILPLCHRCHNKAKRREYQRMAQEHFEIDHTRTEFILLFGRNYLDMEDI